MALQSYYLDIPELRLPERLSVRDLEIVETIGKPYTLKLTVTTASDIDLLEALDKRATFSVCPVPEVKRASLAALFPSEPLKPERQWGGVIRKISKISQSHDERVYAIKMAPRLARLADDIDTKLYQNVDAPTLIQSILKDKLKLTGNDYIIKTSKPYVIHEHSTQYGESTLDYLNRVCEAEGIFYFFTQTDDGSEVIHFADDQSHYTKPVGVKLYRPEAGLESGWTEAVLDLKISAKPVIGNFSFQDYNHRATLRADLQGNKLTQEGTKGFVGKLYQFGQHQKDTDQGNAAAKLAYEIALNDQLTARGESTVLAFSPAQIFRTDVVDPQAEFGWVLTKVKHTAGRNKAWINEFKAIPADRVIRLKQKTPKPTISGTIPARITSPSKYTNSYLSENGLYRVVFNYDADAKAGNWPPAGSSRLMRLARPYAGDTYGMHFPLIDGTEVAVAFHHGNLDRPYIAHALHDQSKPDHVNNRNNTRNIIRTPTNNKIRLEDKDNQQHIKISTEYRKSQLNLGHMVDAQRQKRGDGFELRSDGWGAVRSGKGLFLSADVQAKANGQQLDMARIEGQLASALAQMQSLADTAKMVQAVAADVSKQQELLEQRVKQLQKAVLVASAPEGMAFASGEHMQLSAQQNLIMTAGSDIDIGALKQFSLTTGKAASILALDEDIKIIAAKGNLVGQAMKGEIDLTASKAVQVGSASDQVVVTGSKAVILNSGGAYIKLEGGNIEIGCPGDLTFKSAGFTKTGPSSYNREIAKLANAEGKKATLKLNYQDAYGNTLKSDHLTLTHEEGEQHATQVTGGIASLENLPFGLFQVSQPKR